MLLRAADAGHRAPTFDLDCRHIRQAKRIGHYAAAASQRMMPPIYGDLPRWPQSYSRNVMFLLSVNAPFTVSGTACSAFVTVARECRVTIIFTERHDAEAPLNVSREACLLRFRHHAPEYELPHTTSSRRRIILYMPAPPKMLHMPIFTAPHMHTKVMHMQHTP